MRFLPLLLILAGCSANTGQALLQAIELTECEIGRVSLNGEIKTGANPFAQGSVFLSMEEVRRPEDLPAYCQGVTNE